MNTLNNATPNIGLQTRIRAILRHMRELQVSQEQLNAFCIADNAIETTQEMMQDDDEVQMPETTEAYVEAEQEALTEAADAWLKFLVEGLHEREQHANLG